MMNYQYPQTYLYESGEQVIKIGPTPPPILPSLDASEVEQTLYQRRTDSTESDALQPLQINYENPYYAPLQLSQTAPVESNGKASSVCKPPATPSTPPPPPRAMTTTEKSTKSSVHNDIVAITPQSHANVHNNSASNHSSASNNTTNTTIIESASNHTSHSSHGHSPHSPPRAHKQMGKKYKLPSSAVPVPQLSNPLPPKQGQQQQQQQQGQQQAQQHALTEGIVIPMDQHNYNALLQQMYPYAPAHPPAFNVNMTDSAHSAHSATNPNNPYARNTMATYADVYTPPQYEQNQNHYHLYTPPLPTNNGYYHSATGTNHHYYAPNTAPAVSRVSYHHHHPISTPPYPINYYNGPHSPHAHQHTTHNESAIDAPNSQLQSKQGSDETAAVQYLQRCDGTIISPNADPLTVRMLRHKYDGKDEEADAFTAGDDALFGNNMVTIINVNWSSNIPFATLRMHISNRIHHVPLMDLAHIVHGKGEKHVSNNNHNNHNNNNRYRLNMNNNMNMGKSEAMDDIGTTVIRRNPKLSDETLMKLPHLRKHREYIRTIDVNMGPKDYNSYRVSVNSKNNNNNDDDDCNNSGGDGNNGRTPNIQNLNAKNMRNNGALNLNANLNQNRKKNKRMSACEKGDLFKTELCENWVKKGHCTYGKKCHFAHGRDDIRTRWRIENYKTQPCCDPARADSRLCLFGKRCNYAHPGEPLRRSHHCLYLDEEYQAEILKDYGAATPYPFGIYI